MAVLNRDQILNAKDIKVEKVHVPEWGGDVYLRVISGADRDEYESFVLQSKDRGTVKNFRAMLLAKAICDENGNPIFTNKDIEALGKKNSVVLDRLWQKAMKLNGLTDEEVEKEKENF